ncbi:MAG TPA: AMP-binding protein [Candidatus Dormibacteraeota bacterium]|nr:AMP-binding protein [Candidatus Dormibacteraeota bacterium]
MVGHSRISRALTSRSLVRAFQEQLDAAPDRIAFRYLADGESDEVAVTSAQLHVRALAVARGLLSAARQPGPVLLLTPPGPEFVAGLLGCAYAGAIAVPCYPPNPRPAHVTHRRLVAIARDTGAVLGLTSAAALPSLREVAGGAPELSGVTFLAVDDPNAREPDASRLPADPAAQDLVFLQYTSGSTGAPRGVMVTNENLMANVRAIHEGVAAPDAITSLFWLPPYHDMGLVTMLHALVAGADYVCQSTMHFLRRPARWLQALSRYRATLSGAPNFAFELCVSRVAERDRAGLDLSALDIVFCGSEPIRPDTMRRFTDAYADAGLRPGAVTPVYGLAEATLFVTGAERGAGPTVRRLSRSALADGYARPAPEGQPGVDVVGCGHPRSGHRVAIVRPGGDEELQDGEVGEVWCAGPSVAAGYWRQPERTAATFGPELAGGDPRWRWLRTGDLGFRSGGHLYVTGRAQDLVIVRGRNHHPEDVELTVQRTAPAVRPDGVAVFAVEPGVVEDVAVVCEVERPPADPDGLLAAIRRSITAEHEIEPSAVLLVRSRTIPRTSSGKIQRSACRRALAAGAIEPLAELHAAGGAAAAYEPGAGTGATAQDVRRWLAERVGAVLGVDAAGVAIATPLADLGLDSLKLVELTADLGGWLGMELPVTTAWDSPSIRDIADAVGAVGAAARPAPAGRPDSRLAALLDEIEAMSDDEVRAALVEPERGASRG